MMPFQYNRKDFIPKGFIEVEWYGQHILIAISAIIAVVKTEETCTLTLSSALTGLDTLSNSLNLELHYDDVMALIKSAQ